MSRTKSFEELVQSGARTASHVRKPETNKAYESHFKRFVQFCLLNEFPDPSSARYPELPSLLVAYMESVTSSTSVSHQNAEKIRAAVASYFSKHDRVDRAGPDQWVLLPDVHGVIRAYGNPAKDSFVRQFMRGLKKRKGKEYVQRKAAPISLQMLRVIHLHLRRSTSFTDACKFWFCAVSSFAFYGMCRINEVLSLKWKNLNWGLSRSSKLDPSCTVTYATYILDDRKTDVADSRKYNLHRLSDTERPIDAYLHLEKWFEFVSSLHKWQDNDFVFPALSKICKTQLKTGSNLTGCEKVVIKWGSQMTEQSFINLLNLIVSDVCKNGESLSGFLRHDWSGIWFTSHTFRRAGAQYRFMFAEPEKRWSLRMVEWWAGWSASESTETLVRYLLDQICNSEDDVLADSLAPDRSAWVGCPSTYTEGQQVQNAITSSTPVAYESRFASIEKKLDLILSRMDHTLDAPSAQYALNDTSRHDQPSNTAIPLAFPPSTDWKDFCQMYWRADPARHLFKPLREWTSKEKKYSGVSRSRFSVAKLIGDDVELFAGLIGCGDVKDITAEVFDKYTNYYVLNWQLPDHQRSANALTIDTLAQFVRLDRKNAVLEPTQWLYRFITRLKQHL